MEVAVIIVSILLISIVLFCADVFWGEWIFERDFCGNFVVLDIIEEAFFCFGREIDLGFDVVKCFDCFNVLILLYLGTE